MQVKKPAVICIMGPTATGKTQLAISLSQTFPCDIISVDSAMIYKGMDIGTSKPSAEILKQSPHKLVDIRTPDQSYSAGDFRVDALREINEILSRGRIPLLVGGTILYFRVLQFGIAMLPKGDAEIRQQLEKELETTSLQTLYDRLVKVDPIAAYRIKPTDPQRILRALEVFMLTGKPISSFWSQMEVEEAPYDFLNIGLIPEDRVRLHKDIEMRFQEMLSQGLVEEVRHLLETYGPSAPALRAVNYRQISAYLTGEYDYKTMCDKAVFATRQLAKRQITFLKPWPNLQVFNPYGADLEQKIKELIYTHCTWSCEF